MRLHSGSTKARCAVPAPNTRAFGSIRYTDQEIRPVLACQKEHFRLPDDLHYLNCAYMAPRSDRVEAAGIAAIQRDRVPTAITPELFFSESNRLRALFG